MKVRALHLVAANMSDSLKNLSADIAKNARPIAALERRHTALLKNSGKWKTFFVVENQTFQVGMDWPSRAEARWYRKMLAIALWRLTREDKK